MQDEPTTTVPYVYTSIQNVSAELAKHGIAKDRANQQQGYKFRGIDDCLNALGALLPAHNLVIIPTVLEREVVERTTKSGGALFYVTVKVQFSFVSALDGSRHDAVLYGEAMDSADKATNKAMSAAYKYAVLLTFCVPTEGEDADSVTHEVRASQARPAPSIAPSIAPGVPMPRLDLISPPQASPNTFIVPFGLNRGKPITAIADKDLDWLDAYYLNKMQDPKNHASRYLDEWESCLMAIRAEQLVRYPDANQEPA